MAKRKSNPHTQEELIEILRAQAQRWLDYPNITSVGVGPRIVGGKKTGELAIQVSVTEKIRDPKKLVARGFTRLPRTLRTRDNRQVPVDVVERSFRLSYDLVPQVKPATWVDENALTPRIRRRRRLARIMPGVSVSHPTVGSGTIGAIVYDLNHGDTLVLSNAHVLTGAVGLLGDATVQPGSSDSADFVGNQLGRLRRSHIGLAGDGAVTSIEGRLVDVAVFELGVTPTRVAKVAIGDTVVKSGRTTGVTFGIVERAGIVLRYDYGGAIGIQDIGGFEIAIDPTRPPVDGRLCAGGDSGALWMIFENGAATDIAVGLHFADQTDATSGVDFGLACNIHSLLEKLEVSLIRPT